jgi:hypothetical protein
LHEGQWNLISTPGKCHGDPSYFQTLKITYGLCIDGGGTFTLPRLVGLARAMEIVAFDPKRGRSLILMFRKHHPIVTLLEIEEGSRKFLFFLLDGYP